MKSKYVFAVFAMLLGIVSPVSAADLLYVSMENGTVVTYDTTSNFGPTIATTKALFANTQDTHPWGIAFDSSGNIFVANYSSNSIAKYNSSGQYLSNIGGPSNLSGTTGIAFDSSWNLFAANSMSNSISKFDSSGRFVSNITTNLDYINGLAFDSVGNLYASNSRSNSVTKFDASGVYVGKITSSISYPFGLAFNSSGNLYVANRRGYSVNIYNPSGAYVGSITENLNMPTGLAFDSLGNMYVADDNDHTIKKYDKSGNYLTSWSTPSFPNALAFKPSTVTIPEPSTYALAAIATSTIAYLVRKRHLKPLV